MKMKMNAKRIVKATSCLFVGLFFLVLLLLSYTYYKRDFYRIGVVDFTFWKTNKGCYILPYKYWGFIPPKDDFILASNTCIIHVFVENDTLIHLFAESYMTEKNEIFVNFFLHSYPFDYMQENNENVDVFYDRISYYKSKNLPTASFFIHEL